MITTPPVAARLARNAGYADGLAGRSSNAPTLAAPGDVLCAYWRGYGEGERRAERWREYEKEEQRRRRA